MAAIMNISVIRPSELDSGLCRRWADIVAANAALSSPYFAPEYTQAVASVRDDVYVGVMRDGQDIVGFFPFQRGLGRTGRQVGGPFTDCQGVIVSPEAEWSAEELVRGCGLSLWQFDHVIASQEQFRPWRRVLTCSPMVDLPNGFAAYADTLRGAGSKQMQRLGQKQRGFERDEGPLRFEMNMRDVSALRQLLGWKSQQYLESGLVDAFRFPWTQALLERILGTQSDGFGGVLSALYANDRLAAVHMGMRSRTVWHYWFAAYAHEFARYSPSLLLFAEMARAAETLGLTAIDMGKGPEEYKSLFATSAVLIMEGCVELPSLARTLRTARQSAEDWVRRSPIFPIVRAPGRIIRRLEAKNLFR
jgi:CelD/BcsL family acetyltransferase involved in cellulose biosynthesis